MSKNSMKSEAINLAVVLGLFAAGCTIGMVCEDIFGDSSYVFSIPAFSTVLGGEFIWDKFSHQFADNPKN